MGMKWPLEPEERLMRQAWLSVLGPILWILLYPLGAFAQLRHHEISVADPPARAGSSLPIRISGQWPNTCTPAVLPVQVSGNAIDIRMRRLDQICGEAVTPYSFVVDPAQSAGGLSDGVYRVRLWLRSDGQPDVLLAFRLLDVRSDATRPVQPEAGFWAPDSAGEFATSGTGVGFMVERQAATLALTTNAYLQSGVSSWYLSAGALDLRTFRGDLLATAGGQALWSTYRDPDLIATVGVLEAEFLGAARANFYFIRAAGEGLLDPIEVMPISARRLNFALETDGRSLAGRWSLVPAADAALAPAVFELRYDAARSTATTAILTAASGEELRCELDTSRRDGPPPRCILLAAGNEIARFEQNGLGRLSGRADTTPVLMLRVD
jgi:hypothetical protein